MHSTVLYCTRTVVRLTGKFHAEEWKAGTKLKRYLFQRDVIV
jgi:hypothetical protein